MCAVSLKLENIIICLPALALGAGVGEKLPHASSPIQNTIAEKAYKSTS